MGSIRVHLYQTPEGVKLFMGNFTGASNAPNIFFRGEMTGNALVGDLMAPASGTITGQLSPDGNRLSGSYRMITANDKGTWKARKK
jgi:hypothetical protein